MSKETIQNISEYTDTTERQSYLVGNKALHIGIVIGVKNLSFTNVKNML